MRSSLLAVAVLAVAFSAPASAAVVINFNNVSTDQNVLFAPSTDVSSPTLVGATNQTKTAVMFSNMLGLFANASGSPFSTASFIIAGTAGPAPSEAANVFVGAIGLGEAISGSNTLDLGVGGGNRSSISGTMVEPFTGFRTPRNPTGAGVNSLSQVRLGGESAIPKSAIWMMLLGMACVGYSMRRKNKSTSQISFA